jgi:hypothetical protein
MNVAAQRRAVRLAAVVLAATASMAGAPGAHAVDVSYHAETVQQARRQGAVSAGEVAWQCEGSRCVGIGPWAVPPVTLCAALAREVGPMRSFAQFPAHEIAACNAAAEGRSPGLAPPRPRPPAKPAPGSGQA